MDDRLVRKGSVSKDLDETINMVMPVMLTTMVMLFIIPRLPIVQSAQQYFESQQFVGETDPRTLNATHNPQHIVIDDPWVGAYFINYGPNIVYLKVNSADSLTYPLIVRGTLTFNRLGARDRIYAVYYQCDAGETARVEVLGTY